MQKKNLFALVLAIVMAVSVLGACGAPAATPTPAAPAPSAAPEATVAPPAPGATFKDTVVIGYSSEPDNFNPYGGIGPAKDVSAFATWEMLIYIDINTNELTGVLADSWTDVNKDGTVWDIKIKPDVKFHNGMTMSSEDVKFTWEYAGTGGTGGSDIVQPIAAYKFVDSIEIIDELTARFNLNAGVYDFPTYMETMVLCKEAYDTLPKEEAELIGSGPYYINAAMRQPGVQWGLTRFEDFHGDLANHPTKNIVFKVLPDTNTRIAALEAGEIDLLTDIDASFYSMLDSNPNIELHSRPSGMVYYLGFNYHNVYDEIDDLDLRKAMAYLVDKNAIIQVAFNGEIGAVPSDNFCPPSGLGYASVNNPYSYNLDAAKAILEPMGITPANPLKLTVATYAPQIVEVMQATFAPAGIELTIKPVDLNNWSSFKREGKDYDIFIDYVGYRGALMYNFERFFATGGSAGALMGYTSIKYQPLHDSIMSAGSLDNMLVEFAGLQQWVLDELPLYPLLIKTMISAETAALEGFSPSISADRTYVANVRIPQ